MDSDITSIWYVAPERLCNFQCEYCVSTGAFAKSNRLLWADETERQSFSRVVSWIGGRSYRVGVRLATLGEPFTSREFLQGAAWLTRQASVAFVELLTNGSLLRKRLRIVADEGDIGKLSLWITFHDSQIDIGRLIDNAVYARDEYGCFVVVNALLFPGNVLQVKRIRAAAEEAGLRFNLDLGYEPELSSGGHGEGSALSMVPVLAEGESALRTAESLGANRELLDINLAALSDPSRYRCSAGSRHFFIGIEGDIYRCSRYYAMEKERLGNVLVPGFDVVPEPARPRWRACEAGFGCCNKEDFLNLEIAEHMRRPGIPSLGWLGS